MNRHHRRAAKSSRRQANTDREAVGIFDRADLLRLVAALVDADGSVSGITLISPDGELSYVDAEMLRRGGGRV